MPLRDVIIILILLVIAVAIWVAARTVVWRNTAVAFVLGVLVGYLVRLALIM